MLKKFYLTCACFLTVAVAAAQTLTVTLTPSNYNGFNISCFGAKNGSINTTVTGGTPPYSYVWSNSDNAANITNLAAGFYSVRITDAVNNQTGAEITLEEPEAFKMEVSLYTYPNGYNLSLFNACNGSVTLTMINGIAPITYQWSDGNTTQNRTNLCARNYGVLAIDDNGCKVSSEKIYLNEPERSDWTMGGNANINSATQFVGTTDSKDLIFRTNNIEQFKIKSNGDIKIPSLASNTIIYSSVLADSLGNLFVSKYKTTCLPAWSSDLVRNTITAHCPNSNIKVGIGTRYPIFDFEVFKETLLNADVRMKCQTQVNKNVEMWTINTQGSYAFATDANGKGQIYKDVMTPTPIITFDNNGKVGIGVEPPNTGSLYKLYVEGGIAARDVKVTATSPFPDYVFARDYKLMSLYELEQYIIVNNRLPEMPSAKEVEKNNGYELGSVVTILIKQNEEQALYLIEQQKQIDELKLLVKKLERKN